MTKKRLFWQLFPSLWLITILALIAVTIYITHTFERFYLNQTVLGLKNEALLIKTAIDDKLFNPDIESNQDFCSKLVADSGTRLTVISSTGQVICDSEKNPRLMENHADRPEVKEALSGKTGMAIRYSQTINTDLVYVAVPVYHGDNIVGAIRLSVSIASIHSALSEVYIKVALGSIAFIILIILASIFISRKISRPLESMRLVADQFARGDFDHRLPDHDSIEIGGLSTAMNTMAGQLDERINTVIRQKNEQQAVLRSMVEGVMAVDLDEKILDLNHAAAQMLNISADDSVGKFIFEVIRNEDIQNFVRRALTEKKAIEGEIVLARENVMFLQTHGAVLRDADGEHIGAVIVLNDITRLRHLENMRRDFVANVSHELRTPITSIKGFVETLQDGAIESPDDARRFLDIIAKQADRLNSIIEDLLSLSRIEEKEQKSEIDLHQGRIKPVLIAAIQTCESLSSANAVSMELACDDEIEAIINADLLQQAIVNLLNNAIKYSPGGATIKVVANRIKDGVAIKVIDNGPGIPIEHHDRIFERFYRVDKERSRKLGGTGLGLAIVKHIILAHHGGVTVESTPGKGSTFIITLPSA